MIGQLKRVRAVLLNSVRRRDPAGVRGLQRRLIQQVDRRYDQLNADIRASIVTNDCFNLAGVVAGKAPTVLMAGPVPKEAFKFETVQKKIDGFMGWLHEQQADGILDVLHKAETHASIVTPAWSGVYVDSYYAKGLREAYEKGIKEGRYKLGRAGFGPAKMQTGPMSIYMQQPFHVDRVGLIYSRAYEDLKTVTQVTEGAVRQQIAAGLTSGLARGMAEGRNSGDIARQLVKDVTNKVDQIGRVRAKMIARTETARAYHVSAIAEYREAGAAGVDVKAELLTSGLPNVCGECIDLETDGPYTLDQVEFMIPVHPNCACTTIPFLEGDKLLHPRQPVPGSPLSRLADLPLMFSPPTDSAAAAIESAERVEATAGAAEAELGAVPSAKMQTYIDQLKAKGLMTREEKLLARLATTDKDSSLAAKLRTELAQVRVDIEANPFATSKVARPIVDPVVTVPKPPVPISKPVRLTTKQAEYVEKLRAKGLMTREDKLMKRLATIRSDSATAAKIRAELEDVRLAIAKNPYATSRETIVPPPISTTTPVPPPQPTPVKVVRPVTPRPASKVPRMTAKSYLEEVDRLTAAIPSAAEREQLADYKLLTKQALDKRVQLREAMRSSSIPGYDAEADIAKYLGLDYTGNVPPYEHPFRAKLLAYRDDEIRRERLRQIIEANERKRSVSPGKDLLRRKGAASKWNVRTTDIGSGYDRQRAESAAKFLDDLIEPKYTDRMTVSFNLSGNRRASALRLDYLGQNTCINYTSMCDSYRFAHEMGHAVEHANKEWMPRIHAWLEKRRGGEAPKELRKLVPGSNYSAGERSFRDKFRNVYVGKTYSNGCTEVISMGLQYMYDNPVAFAREDPDMFELILGLVKGYFE